MNTVITCQLRFTTFFLEMITNGVDDFVLHTAQNTILMFVYEIFTN